MYRVVYVIHIPRADLRFAGLARGCVVSNNVRSNIEKCNMPDLNKYITESIFHIYTLFVMYTAYSIHSSPILIHITV